MRIVENPSSMDVEDITRTESLEPVATSPAGLTILDAEEAAKEEQIAATTPRSDDRPRMSNGAKIKQNRNLMRSEKIRRTELRADTGAEMDYKKLFTKFEEAFLSKDIKAIGECLSPAFQWNLPNGKDIFGKREALEEMELRFAMPGGPKFSRALWKFKGKTVIQTYRVEFQGPDGKWRKAKGMDLYKIRDGLIARKDAYWKMVP